MRRILQESGIKAARRFIDSRGGSAKWEAAAREIGRAVRALEQSSKKGNLVPRSIKFVITEWRTCRDSSFQHTASHKETT